MIHSNVINLSWFLDGQILHIIQMISKQKSHRKRL